MAGESSSLLPMTRESSVRLNDLCTKAPCCVTSKAACWILLWNFAVLLAYEEFYNVDILLQVGSLSTPTPIAIAATLTLISIFAPLAGLLTDVKFSRYRAVKYSSYAIIVKLSFLFVIVSPVLVVYLITGSLTSSIVVYIGIAFFSPVYIIFIINALQFGMDQLHSSSTEDSILFIHWYVWIYYTCSLITATSWNFLFYGNSNNNITMSLSYVGLGFLVFSVAAALSLLVLSLCILHHRKVLFLLEPAGVNPYKLVYRVTSFVWRHKVPLRRSAFTYCTEELPSRMDVGKHKYGGPFTTKQVEDVKAFWGILKIVLSVGPAYLFKTVTQSLLPEFAKHANYFFLNETVGHQHIHLEGIARYIIISNGLLSPLLVVICIPLYLCWIRPHIRYHIPGMLKRMGLALVLMVFSLVITLAMDIVVHLRHNELAHCMLKGFQYKDYDKVDDIPSPPLFQNVYFFALLTTN